MATTSSVVTKGWDADERPIRAGYNPGMVQRYCVNEHTWQVFRLSLKGQPTHVKLDRLAEWYDGWGQAQEYSQPIRELQVGNYLGALRRGGQLDASNQIRKYL